jgi:hypothetical protein
MQTRKKYFIGFVVLALAQVFVPMQMITTQRSISKKGTEFKFKIEPVDPHDPFRGKYINLRFDANRYTDMDVNNWSNGQSVYLGIGIDSLGFARIDKVYAEKPTRHSDYLKTKISYISNLKSRTILNFDFPFNRFYMEESKAPEAENLTMRFDRDSSHVFHAVVYILNGKTALGEVYIDDEPLGKYIHRRQ